MNPSGFNIGAVLVLLYNTLELLGLWVGSWESGPLSTTRSTRIRELRISQWQRQKPSHLDEQSPTLRSASLFVSCYSMVCLELA